MVMASAKRLIEVRQLCLNSNRIAEINVPAWPIPIHHTKLTIANPQPMGMLMPQIPVPRPNRYATAVFSIPKRDTATAKMANQKIGVCLVSTMPAMRSVAVPRSYPGPITGGLTPFGGSTPTSSTIGAIELCLLRGLEFRVRIPHRRNVGGARARIQLSQQLVIPLLGFELRNAAVGIIDVAEDNGFGGANLLARGQDVAVFDIRIRLFGGDTRGVDALHAISALFHDAAAAHADIQTAC